MEATAGLVHNLKFSRQPSLPPTLYAWIGPSPSRSEKFYLLLEDADPAGDRALKASMIDTLALAMANRLGVTVYHEVESPQIKHMDVSGNDNYCPSD